MTPTTPWGNERGQLPQRLRVGSHLAGRRQARRLSRRFARVGVSTSPDRLRQMLAGSPVAQAEVCDFDFARIAAQNSGLLDTEAGLAAAVEATHDELAIAAAALDCGGHLATFDRDFERVGGLALTVLS